jgi:diacylglycerol kinase (ATP)
MKNRRFSDAFKYAWAGIRHTALNERNFKIHLTMAALAVAACVVLRVEAGKFIAVIFAIFFMLGMELVNTAVESIMDLICKDTPHPLAKTAKDAAAGAVLVAAVNALAVAGYVAWGILFN